MPRFKPYDYRQGLMVPLVLEDQLPAGSLEGALHHLIEDRIDDAWFDDLYANDEIARLTDPDAETRRMTLFKLSHYPAAARERPTP